MDLTIKAYDNVEGEHFYLTVKNYSELVNISLPFTIKAKGKASKVDYYITVESINWKFMFARGTVEQDWLT